MGAPKRESQEKIDSGEKKGSTQNKRSTMWRHEEAVFSPTVRFVLVSSKQPFVDDLPLSSLLQVACFRLCLFFHDLTCLFIFSYCL